MRRRADARAAAVDFDDAATLFSALGDTTRLALVKRLGDEGALSLARLTETTDVTRQAVTKHLRLLEGAGLVTSERHGRETMWTLERARFEDARTLLDAVSTRWDMALEALRVMVEEPSAPTPKKVRRARPG